MLFTVFVRKCTVLYVFQKNCCCRHSLRCFSFFINLIWKRGSISVIMLIFMFLLQFVEILQSGVVAALPSHNYTLNTPAQIGLTLPWFLTSDLIMRWIIFRFQQFVKKITYLGLQIPCRIGAEGKTRCIIY